MRNPETNREAPAPWVSANPATLKPVGKAENPLTVIPTPGAAPYNQKETPSAHFFVERERVGRSVQHSSFLGVLPKVLASISPVLLERSWDLAYSRCPGSQWEQKWWFEVAASSHHSPSLRLHSEQAGEKPQIPASPWGRNELDCVWVYNIHVKV